jgi:hypothetical protein
MLVKLVLYSTCLLTMVISIRWGAVSFANVKLLLLPCTVQASVCMLECCTAHIVCYCIVTCGTLRLSLSDSYELFCSLNSLHASNNNTLTHTQRIEAQLNFQTVLDPDVLTSQLSALTSLQSLDMYTSYFDENALLSDAPPLPTVSNGQSTAYTTGTAEGTNGEHYSR